MGPGQQLLQVAQLSLLLLTVLLLLLPLLLQGRDLGFIAADGVCGREGWRLDALPFSVRPSAMVGATGALQTDLGRPLASVCVSVLSYKTGRC